MPPGRFSRRPDRTLSFSHSCLFHTSCCVRLLAWSLSASTPSASTIAANFLSRFQSLGPQTRTQLLDANQLQRCSLTLHRDALYPGFPSLSNAAPPAPGTPIPPGYHLVYFTPAFLECQLGADGTDASYNPYSPFTRRMWAGGEVRWPRPGGETRPNLLRVGQEVRETTAVLSAEAKTVRKTGEEMVVVGVEKVFENEDGVAIVDRRNWVFREALQVSSSPCSQTRQASYPQPSSNHAPPSARLHLCPGTNTHIRHLCQSSVTLFRFSALTFNAHKIHYSLPWAQYVEGHRGLVVHAPLNLISILDFWRDIHGQQRGGAEYVVPESIAYRATSPLYADEAYQIVLEHGERGDKANIYGPGAVVSMKAEIAAS